MDPIRYLMLFSGVEKIADDTQVSFSALFGLWVHCLNVPQLQDARRYAQKFNELSAKQTDSGILLQAHYVIGSFDLLVGNFSLVHARFKMKLSDNVCLETFSVRGTRWRSSYGCRAVTTSLFNGSGSCLCSGHP